MDAQAKSSGRIPHHVAIIMDGNGRWAEQRGLERAQGHRAGMEAVRQTVRAADELGVGWLTLYAFSSENWKRPRREVDTLMRLPGEYFQQQLPEAVERNIRILSVGRLSRLPWNARRQLQSAAEKTAQNTGMRLVFALSYGGRGEIVDAVQRLLRAREQAAQKGAAPAAIDEKSFAAYLDQPAMPDVDLLIRTGAEQRVSNFLLWHIAYAEIVTTELMWPDFHRAQFEAAVAVFQNRERRFGLTPAQARAS